MTLRFEAAVRTQQGNEVLRESARALPDNRLLMPIENRMEKLTRGGARVIRPSVPLMGRIAFHHWRLERSGLTSPTAMTRAEVLCQCSARPLWVIFEEDG